MHALQPKLMSGTWRDDLWCPGRLQSPNGEANIPFQLYVIRQSTHSPINDAVDLGLPSGCLHNGMHGVARDALLSSTNTPSQPCTHQRTSASLTPICASLASSLTSGVEVARTTVLSPRPRLAPLLKACLQPRDRRPPALDASCMIIAADVEEGQAARKALSPTAGFTTPSLVPVQTRARSCRRSIEAN